MTLPKLAGALHGRQASGVSGEMAGELDLAITQIDARRGEVSAINSDKISVSGRESVRPPRVLVGAFCRNSRA